MVLGRGRLKLKKTTVTHYYGFDEGRDAANWTEKYTKVIKC